MRVSRDSSMVWMIVRVNIRYSDQDSAGKAKIEESKAAWISAYEKRDGRWIMVAVTSTFEPLASSR